MFDANVMTISKDVQFLYQLICVDDNYKLILKPQNVKPKHGTKIPLIRSLNSEGNQE